MLHFSLLYFLKIYNQFKILYISLLSVVAFYLFLVIILRLITLFMKD